MKLTPRLQAIADQIPPDSVVADIGTDHAYIPVYLLSNHLASRVIGTDSRKGPLDAAEQTLKLFNLSKAADIRLGAGLSVLTPEDSVQVIVIAGMGGETICSILAEGESALAGGVRLVLQPMTDPGLVRKWLAGHGWSIVQEDIALEGRTYYEIIAAEKNTQAVLTSPELEIGPLLVAGRHPLLRPMLEQRLRRLRQAAYRAGRSQTASGKARAQELRAKADYLREVLSWL